MTTTTTGSPKNKPRLPNLGHRWEAANDRGEPRYVIPCSISVSPGSPRRICKTRSTEQVVPTAETPFYIAGNWEMGGVVVLQHSEGERESSIFASAPNP